MTEKQRQWIIWGVIAVVFVVATVLGISLPIPLPSPPPLSQGITGFDRIALDSGTAALPSYTFQGDTDTGLYRIGANDLGVAAGGSKVGEFSSAGYTGYIAAPAEGYAVYNTVHDVTAAELKAGHTLVTIPAGKTFRMAHIMAVAYGGACITATTEDVKAAAVILARYATAQLAQSALIDMKTAGVTLLDDGASFAAQPDGVDVMVIQQGGGDTAGCTGVRFILSYALQ